MKNSTAVRPPYSRKASFLLLGIFIVVGGRLTYKQTDIWKNLLPDALVLVGW